MSRLWRRLLFLLRHRRFEADLDEEMRLHLEMKIEENLEQAHRAARRQLGNSTRLREASREPWTLRWLEAVAQDLRYAVRTLSRSPGFTVVALLTLSLGIGSTTAVFSICNAVLLRPLPYKDPDRLVMQDMAIFYHPGWARLTLAAGDEPESIQGAFVSANSFSLLGLPPALGRAFGGDEVERGERVVMLSHGFWQRRFGASEEILGKTVEAESKRFQIIGVMPRLFQLPTIDAELWAPITTHPRWSDSKGRIPRRWSVIGRLKPAVTIKGAQAEMRMIASRLERAYPGSNAGRGIQVIPLDEQTTGRARKALSLLFVAVVFAHRSSDAFDRVSDARCRGACSRLRPRAPGDEGRSAGGAAP